MSMKRFTSSTLKKCLDTSIIAPLYAIYGLSVIMTAGIAPSLFIASWSNDCNP